MTGKFSVIIPLYNKGPHIARAVNSVLNQTFRDFELLVVDDESSDEGPDIVRKYQDPRVTLIEQDHRGASLTRNHGVELARNDLIAFLDADDEWRPGFLETILRLVENYPQAGMFTTAWKISAGEEKTRWANFQYIPPFPWEGLLPDYFRSGALGEDPVMASCVVIPRTIFHETGGYPEGYWYGEDTDLFGKIALKYPVAFSWEFGAIYHVDASNRSSVRKVPLEYEEPFVTTARSALMRGQVRSEIMESLNEFIAKKEIYRCYLNLHEGNLKTARGILQHCTTKIRRYERTKLMILAHLPVPLYLFLRDIRQYLIRRVQKKSENSSARSRQKIGLLSGIRRPWMSADSTRSLKTFESEQEELFSRRKAWLEKHPEYSNQDLRQFDTGAYYGENVLVISPHPDDEIIGCGGILIKLREGGSKISILQLTDGSRTAALQDSPEHIRKSIRLKEAETVAADLGVSNLFLFREVDSELHCTAENVKKLSGILNTLRPKIIFIPFMNDKHPDHVVANEILKKALESSALDLLKVHILSYEVWNFVPPNSYCCINGQFRKKTTLLRKYRTPMKVIDYVQFCKSLNSYHAFTLLGKKGFAEVFLDIDAKRYRDLI